MIVVSSELTEVMRVSDRVLVMRDGAVVAELGRDELSEEAIVSHAVPEASRQLAMVRQGQSHVRDQIRRIAAAAPRPAFGSFSVRDAGTLIGLVAIVVIFALAGTGAFSPSATCSTSCSSRASMPAWRSA